MVKRGVEIFAMMVDLGVGFDSPAKTWELRGKWESLSACSYFQGSGLEICIPYPSPIPNPTPAPH